MTRREAMTVAVLVMALCVVWLWVLYVLDREAARPTAPAPPVSLVVR